MGSSMWRWCRPFSAGVFAVVMAVFGTAAVGCTRQGADTDAVQQSLASLVVVTASIPTPASATAPPASLADIAPKGPVDSEPAEEGDTSTVPSLPAERWANHTYPVTCLGFGEPEITLKGGEQEALPDNTMIHAKLESFHEFDDGNTLVMIKCVVATDQFGYQAILVDPGGEVLDQLGIPAVDSIDEFSVAIASPEGWEAGTNPRDAASVHLDELEIVDDQINLVEGPIVPRCAAMGSQVGGRSDGPETNQQGALVSALQQRLADLGYGDKIPEEESVAAIFGDGTVEAFTVYFQDNYDPANRSQPAPWSGKDDGSKIYWLDISWNEVLELECFGEYRPTVPNDEPTPVRIDQDQET